MEYEIREDREQKKFYIPLPEGEAYIQYEKRDADAIEYIATYVSPEQRGTPYGRKLVRYALNYAKENRLKVIPTCPYVRKILLRERSEPGDPISASAEGLQAK